MAILIQVQIGVKFKLRSKSKCNPFTTSALTADNAWTIMCWSALCVGRTSAEGELGPLRGPKPEGAPTPVWEFGTMRCPKSV